MKRLGLQLIYALFDGGARILVAVVREGVALVGGPRLQVARWAGGDIGKRKPTPSRGVTEVNPRRTLHGDVHITKVFSNTLNKND